MRKVNILVEYYPPDVAATGQFMSELAEDLQDDGWKVSVITAKPSYVED